MKEKIYGTNCFSAWNERLREWWMVRVKIELAI